MKQWLVLVLALLASVSFAEGESKRIEDSKSEFRNSEKIFAFIESISADQIDLPWLPNAIVARYPQAKSDDKMAMINTRALFEKWCEAQSGKIWQPDPPDCVSLRDGGRVCAVGDLIYDTQRSNLVWTLKDLARKNGSSITMLWGELPWVISGNTLSHIFLNSPKNEKVVGGLQRCMKDNSLWVGMIFAEIQGKDNHNLIFISDKGYNELLFGGKVLSTADVEKRNEELVKLTEKIRKERADAIAKAAKELAESLRPGDIVRRFGSNNGMVIEVKLPLVYVQWNGDMFGTPPRTEWVKAEELSKVK